jgi:hypothetical protein
METVPPPSQTTLTRGAVLKRAAYLTGTIAATSVLATLAPSRVWALQLAALPQDQTDTLVALSQVLYPHANLPTAVYAMVPKDLDAKADKDPATASLIASGCADLDKATGGSFVKATPDAQLAAVKAAQGSDFFNLVRGQCITSIYNNELAWAHFGYQGASWPHGGYLHRGFQDLTWLPNPPLEASPKPWA